MQWKADADFESRRRQCGEQSVVVTTAPAAAFTSAGEGDAGDENEIYTFRRDDIGRLGGGLLPGMV